ncbi:NUDIX domain-containing protein [Caballeronia sp. LZ043]|uniref:NUDIX hydrolase n=1 Tax=Caballeronia sp. LZ043 TaxID=3038569 RepID=UPI00286643A8|nr:NUDIX domain-containing protein [Caballeronia sp. LZ043]MDR5822482.1 NUDIX domain-containing protein [Caballeronia sp. LZ043]
MKRRATVICERDGLVLLVAREGGRWAFPGGRQKREEDLLDTARRELKEETGLDISSVRYAFQFLGLRTRHFVFIARVAVHDDAIASNEIARCQWMRLDELVHLEASIPTKGIAAIFLKQKRSGTWTSMREAIDSTAV